MVKYKQFKAELIKRGCCLVRHGANHDIWYNPATKLGTTIPRHDSKEVPTGTAKKIMKMLGINDL